jgi:crotonobetainyl-CoA:carnitine CoA-transferase CaiB-like acyl-CoA transferase
VEREVIIDLPDDQAGYLPMHNVTPRLSGTPGAIRRPAPAMGEHTDALLKELGFDPAEIDAMRASGVL